MTVRSDLATALKAALASNYKIVAYPDDVDGLEPNRPVICLYRDRVEKAPNAQGVYFSTIALWVVSPNTNPAVAEDKLDASLDEVVAAVDSIPWIQWKTAERSLFGNAQRPAYRLDIQVATNKE